MADCSCPASCKQTKQQVFMVVVGSCDWLQPSCFLQASCAADRSY